MRNWFYAHHQDIKMVRNKFLFLGIIIISLLLIYGCSYKNVNSNTKNIKIGLILPLTGDIAKFGEGMLNAAELARNDSDKNVTLIVEDDKSCDQKESVTAINKLILVDKVKAVVGSVCSHSMLAISPIAENNHIILISPSATSQI